MADLSLVEKVLLLESTLRKRRIPHAFGGALAFAYYGEPRATVDIDVNIFSGADQFERVMGLLEAIGVTSTASADVVRRDGQVRVWWGDTPVDLFFSYDPLHVAMRAAARRVPFSHTTIPILGPEHLIVAKVAFNRAKDWIDIEQMLIALPSLDRETVHHWLDRLVGPDDPRSRHLQDLEGQLLGDV
jgi:hypothetical protein